MTPHSLRCEYLPAPLNVECPTPRLSWKLDPHGKGHRQTAWQVLVADTAEALLQDSGSLWDSGQIAGENTVFTPYAGRLLNSRQRCFWKVRYWDENGQPSDWSTPAQWEMGLLSADDWNAQWVGGTLTGGPRTSVPAPFLRRSFHCDARVASARLYVTALGLYECQINGQTVGNAALAPGWTDYAQRVPYQAYDVTGLLQGGDNAVGLILGDGWYSGFVAWKGRQRYGAEPKALVQLEIALEDGTRQTVVSDSSWRHAYGPILASDLLNGESYDARLEFPAWSLAGFEDSTWIPVRTFHDITTRPSASLCDPVIRAAELSPLSEPVVAPPNPYPTWSKAYIFDLGQNLTGRIRLKVSAPRGTQLTIRYAEILNPDGSMYTTNLRSAEATDLYTCRGGGEETWEPRFTYHGFRYVEIQGLPEPPDRGTVTALVMHTGMAETGRFACSNPLINQLQHNIGWGQIGNMLEIPSDCPQRDERLGWTGDAQVFIRTAAFNRDVAGFFAKWQDDLSDAQLPNGDIPPVAPTPPGVFDMEGGPAWSDAVIICPWTLYLCYEDRGLLARHYPSMQRFLEALVATSRDLIRCHPDSSSWCFGDWLALDGCTDLFGSTPRDLLGTAFLAYDARLLGKIARILGHDADAEKYESLFQAVRTAYQERFLSPEGEVTGNTQTAYVLTLHFDLAPASLRPRLAERLVADIRSRGNKLSTGFVGTPYLLHVLSAAGYTDVAYDLLLQEDWPSWLYAVTHGATTIWERWDGWTADRGFQDPTMNSFNHYAYGAVGDWIYQNVAGIDLDEALPAYRRSYLRPQPGGGISHASASLETVHGRLSIDWQIQGEEFTAKVTIPPNTTSLFDFPAAFSGNAMVSGRALSQARSIPLEPGDHLLHSRRGNQHQEQPIHQSEADASPG